MKTNSNKTEKNVNVKETTKNVNAKDLINNSKNLLNDEQLINLDFENLDLNNLDNLVSKLSTNLKQTKTDKKRIYKQIDLESKDRTKLRKKRNKFIDNIIFYYSNKLTNELKNEIKSFNEFYKEVYFLNDYSLNSICENNSDNDTKLKVKTILEIIKRTK